MKKGGLRWGGSHVVGGDVVRVGMSVPTCLHGNGYAGIRISAKGLCLQLPEEGNAHACPWPATATYWPCSGG